MIPPICDVVVLSWDTPDQHARRARDIAIWLGAETRIVGLNAACTGRDVLRRLVPTCRCLIANADTLILSARRMSADFEELLTALSELAGHVFVHGFKASEDHDRLVQALTNGALRGVRASRAGGQFHVATNRQWTAQFSGLSLGTLAARDCQFADDRPPAPHLDVLVRAADAPFFLRTEHNGGQFFLSACTELADLDESIQRGFSCLEWFSRLMPLTMFLRGALEHRVWRNNHPRACFIIDDPLLRHRYGFLEYTRLVEAMRPHRFFPCFAFIPWNYRRSQREVAALLSSSYGVPYLCVHGCDHTRGEFASTDVPSLRGKALLALERMRLHVRLTGVPFDDVMVFPQGLFSPEALAALKSAGYLAAVNSDPFPSTQAMQLTLRDLVDVAITRFGGFPLFGRRYPSDLAEFAWDLFLGKPALAVEHHGYFQDGCASLESFVTRLNGLDSRLEWTNLGTICSRASLTKAAADGDVHVRFYTHHFYLTNGGLTRRNFTLFRRPDSHGLHSTIDAGITTSAPANAEIRTRVALEPGETSTVHLSPPAGTAARPWKGTARHNAAVRIRRYLSEIRDNHVDTNPVLHGIVARARSSRRAKMPETMRDPR